MVVERERERERYGEGSGREIWAEPRPRAGLSAGGRSSASPPSHSDAAGGGEILLMCLTVPAVRLLRRSDKTPNKEL